MRLAHRQDTLTRLTVPTPKHDDDPSLTGVVFTLCGGAVAYQSKLQTTVVTSSTEAEFIAAVQAAKTAKYLATIRAV